MEVIAILMGSGMMFFGLIGNYWEMFYAGVILTWMVVLKV